MFYFLTAVLILYFIAPRKLKNTVLMLSSLVFYGWGEPKYVILMIISVTVGYITGLLIEVSKRKWQKRLMMIISVVVNLSFLVYFKYADFFIENFNAVFGVSIPLLRIALPIGISFYTFQILSYTVDVYRGDVEAQKNIINLAAYITMFPQLIAGPIVRYSDINRELSERQHSFENYSLGIRRFIFGLAKKILIANALGELCDNFKASNDKSVMFYWLYAIAFMLHIYFDFSGYSDMAIGLGRMFGFHFIENFNYPYVSGSITEFWRRWHISLGSWFRDYVYIPMGGNRVNKVRWMFNILTVWMLTGFWHGAAWNFIIWGLFFAVLLVLEKLFLGRFLGRSRVISRIYVLFFVMISFIIFNAADMGEAFEYIGGLFSFGSIPIVSSEFFYNLRNYAVVLVLGIIGSTPLVKRSIEKLSDKKTFGRIINVLEPVVLSVLLIVMTAYLVDGSFNPFLYFRF